MSDKGDEERNREYALDGIGQYLISSDGELLQKLIRVHEHDHNGKTWSYITFEYLHANDLAKLAVTMYLDGKLQLEMDFFMSVCKGNQWQVGHIGLSDRDHKYWILCLIIAKSENHHSAGLLLKRATELLNNAGGDGRCVLVDGGKALDKAIGEENEERVQNALEEIRNGSGMLLELDHSSTPADASNTTCDISIDAACDEICGELMEAFIGQCNDDEGDVEGRKNLEVRLTKLLVSHKLELMKCLAHIVRNAGSRGGGWRGGKGSLCRALLSGGCPKKTMYQILGVVFMMANIPCGDKVTFENALEGLLEKYEDDISGYVKTAYLNGNPNCLGGHCSKRPGEVTSTQGMERRGGEIKISHQDILSEHTNPRKESSNPIHLMAAVARDQYYHSSGSDPLAKFASVPSRPGKDNFFGKACNTLRELSDYSPPATVTQGSGRKQKVNNLCSTWLYSFLFSGEEELSHDVLGNKGLSIEFYFATASRTLTTLKMLRKAKLAALSGAPVEILESVPFKEEDLGNVEKLCGMLTTLPIGERKELRANLALKRLHNTPERKPGESLAAFLFRRAHRNADSDALVEMSNKLHAKKSQPKDKKKNKPKGTKSRKKKELASYEQVSEAQLALDKDGGEICNDDSLTIDTTLKRSTNTKPNFKAEFAQIDGPGGAIEAALQVDFNDATPEWDAGIDCAESVRDRVIVKKELGDWIKATYDSGNGEIRCDCKRFNYYGDCPHCVFIEVLHLEKYPDGNANEQWQEMRKKMIHNLKVECGRLTP